MMNQNKEYEDMPVKEKKKKQELREAGMDVNGEFSMDSLKKWFRRAGGALSICAAAVCLMAVLMMGKNRKESLIMEVNSDIMMEFTMNRRGSVLSAKGMMARSNEAVSMTVFEGKSLGIAVGKIFDRLADNNSLGEDGGILISVRKSGAEVKASPEKIVKELQKQTESELQKKESRATVYVFESEEDTKTREIADKYGITVTKAEFLKHLFSENPGITIGKQEELAGYSSKRLIREINEQEYQISLKPVVVKTTFEKASEETTEESTPEETAALETTEAVSEQKSGALDTGEERESTKNDGLSEMQRRRKALEAGESVDWVDQETNRELSDPDEKDRLHRIPGPLRQRLCRRKLRSRKLRSRKLRNRKLRNRKLRNRELRSRKLRNRELQHRKLCRRKLHRRQPRRQQQRLQRLPPRPECWRRRRKHRRT